MRSIDGATQLLIFLGGLDLPLGGLFQVDFVTTLMGDPAPPCLSGDRCVGDLAYAAVQRLRGRFDHQRADR